METSQVELLMLQYLNFQILFERGCRINTQPTTTRFFLYGCAEKIPRPLKSLK